MKKLLLFGCLGMAFALGACKKCQTCTTSTTQNTGIGPAISTSTSEQYCGDDYDNAPAEVNVTQDVGGGVSQTVVVSCSDD